MGTTTTDPLGNFSSMDENLAAFRRQQVAAAAAAAEKAKAEEHDRLASQATVNPYAGAALQGLTFGLGDEATALARSTLGSTPYDQALAEERASNEKFSKENPWSNVGMQVAGALPHIALSRGRTAPQVYGPPVAKIAPSVGRLVAKAAGIGGAEGAAQGYGEGEGGVVPRVVNAAQSALMGTVMGGATDVVSQGVTAGGKYLWNKFAPAFSDNQARRVAQLKVAQNLEREGGTGLAQQNLADYAGQVADNATAGLPNARLTMGEITGGAPRNAMDDAVNMPSAGAAEVARQLAERQAGRPTRVREAMTTVFGDLDAPYTAKTRLYDERRATATPLYDRAFEGARPLTAGDIEYLQRVPAGAVAYAQQLAQADGRRLSFVPRYDEHGTMITNNLTPSPEDMHHLKVGMDMFLQANSPNGRPNQLAGRFAEVRDTIRDRLDALTTDANGQSLYRTARDAWAGPTARADAIAFGENAAGMARDELQARIARMTPAEQAFVVQGWMGDIRQKLNRVKDSGNANPVNAVFANQEQRDTAEVMLGAMGLPRDQVADRFRQLSNFFAHEIEGAGGETQMIRGSQTAPRQSWKEDLSSVAIPGAAGSSGFFHDPITGAITMGTLALGGAGHAVMRHGNEQVRTQMLRMLGATDPAAHQATMAAIAERARQVAAGGGRPGQTWARTEGLAAGQAAPRVLDTIFPPDDQRVAR